MSLAYGSTIYSNYSTSSIYVGEIQIESDRWQLITVPVIYGYWDTSNHVLVHDGVTIARVKNYVLDQIEDIMGNPVQSYIKVVNTYIGDNNYFYNYIPGVTNPLSTHNFPLAYLDGDRVEYVAFWIKSIHTSDIIIKWGE
jgi:hypothetical protein